MFECQSALTYFNIFRSGRLVDIHEVFGALSICATASLNEVLKWNFRFYDAQGYGRISRADLITLVESVIRGMSKITGGTAPVVSETHSVFQHLFSGAKFSHEDEITYAEFSKALQHSDPVRQLITHFPATGDAMAGLFGPGPLRSSLPPSKAKERSRYDSEPIKDAFIKRPRAPARPQIRTVGS